ncbi:4-hydroxyacetophenone monooxygenase [Hysterangium stoloniferum]|nr:4-hydroxyacetophenone monooxygenase [Hysterangium stoloniferum]
MSKENPVKYNQILCVGLGFSGVCLGAQLRRKLGFTDIHFYDRDVTHSGTWHANQYPGCASDVPAIAYSFSFELNPNWSRLFPGQEEIHNYINGVVDKYQLRRHMTFQTECESATWHSDRQRWTVHLKDIVTGERYTHECKILFSAVGGLVTPKYPDIPGQDVFGGPIFHTARWRSDVDLKNKDIVVIGNGCSGTQVVPHLVPLAKTLTQFINTPHWLIYKSNPEMKLSWKLFILDEEGAAARRQAEENSKEFIFKTAPEKFHDILIPKWEFGCKRRIWDTDGSYLKSLCAPNVHLTKDPIIEILPHAVRTATKTYPVDVIICATGFDLKDSIGPIKIYGREGRLLNDHWQNVGGPSAYNGMAVHGFPNFIMLFGPNTATGHTSVVSAIENTVNCALKLVKPVIRGEVSEFEVTEEAESKYTRDVQAATKETVWTKCRSYYIADGGWNGALYPWSQYHFWWRMTFPTWSDWSFKLFNRTISGVNGLVDP